MIKIIGDRVIIHKVHEVKAAHILSEILKYSKKHNKFILGLAGVAGVGKTEIAQVLQELLFKHKLRTTVVHIDDYYSNHWSNRNSIRRKTGIIGKEEINWKKLNKVIYDFKTNKKKLYVQSIHKFINAIEHSIVPGRCIDIIIIEGLYAGYCDVDYKVYLAGQTSDTYKFRKLRMKENPDNLFRHRVLEKESNCVSQSKCQCNLIVPFNYEQ